MSTDNTDAIDPGNEPSTGSNNEPLTTGEDPSLRAIYNVLNEQPNGGLLAGYLKQIRSGVMQAAVRQGYDPDNDLAAKISLERSTGGQPQPSVVRGSPRLAPHPAFVGGYLSADGLVRPGSQINMAIPNTVSDRQSALIPTILRHEGEHTRQGPSSLPVKQMGTAEIGPTIGDIVNQAQAFQYQTGRPLEVRLSNASQTYQPSVEWMARMGIQHGLTSRSMDQLLATQPGQAWLRKMIEGSEKLRPAGSQQQAATRSPTADPTHMARFTNDLFEHAHYSAGKKLFPHPSEYLRQRAGSPPPDFKPGVISREDVEDFQPLVSRMQRLGLNSQSSTGRLPLQLFSQTKFYRRLANRFMRSPDSPFAPEDESQFSANVFFPQIPPADHALFLQALGQASQGIVNRAAKRRVGDRNDNLD